MQKVSLGITCSGTPGFFTKRMLAMPLAQADFQRAQCDRVFAVILADRYRFTYVDTAAETFDDDSKREG